VARARRKARLRHRLSWTSVGQPPTSFLHSLTAVCQFLVPFFFLFRRRSGAAWLSLSHSLGPLSSFPSAFPLSFKGDSHLLSDFLADRMWVEFNILSRRRWRGNVLGVWSFLRLKFSFSAQRKSLRGSGGPSLQTTSPNTSATHPSLLGRRPTPGKSSPFVRVPPPCPWGPPHVHAWGSSSPRVFSLLGFWGLGYIPCRPFLPPLGLLSFGVSAPLWSLGGCSGARGQAPAASRFPLSGEDRRRGLLPPYFLLLCCLFAP